MEPSYSKLTIFRRASVKLREGTKNLKGQYLGNVITSSAKGESCIDIPLTLLWSNYLKTDGKQTIPMTVAVDNNGLKAVTSSQGLTHYWCHWITYYCIPKSHPRLFIWIYRHSGKNLKVELRCHALLLRSSKKASKLHEQLGCRVSASYQEYKREKAQRNQRRLLHHKAATYLLQHQENHGRTCRTRLLATNQNYKPPVSFNSQTLHVIEEESCSCSSDSSGDESDGSNVEVKTLLHNSESGSFSPKLVDEDNPLRNPLRNPMKMTILQHQQKRQHQQQLGSLAEQETTYGHQVDSISPCPNGFGNDEFMGLVSSNDPEYSKLELPRSEQSLSRSESQNLSIPARAKAVNNPTSLLSAEKLPEQYLRCFDVPVDEGISETKIKKEAHNDFSNTTTSHYVNGFSKKSNHTIDPCHEMSNCTKYPEQRRDSALLCETQSYLSENSSNTDSDNSDSSIEIIKIITRL